jgi:hypothetical protein
MMSSLAAREDRRYSSSVWILFVNFVPDLDTTWRSESRVAEKNLRKRVGGREKVIGISSNQPVSKTPPRERRCWTAAPQAEVIFHGSWFMVRQRGNDLLRRGKLTIFQNWVVIDGSSRARFPRCT